MDRIQLPPTTNGMVVEKSVNAADNSTSSNPAKNIGASCKIYIDSSAQSITNREPEEMIVNTERQNWSRIKCTDWWTFHIEKIAKIRRRSRI